MSKNKQCTCDTPFMDCPNAMIFPCRDKWYCTLPIKTEKYMLKIFAKLGTDQKAAIYCHPGQTQAIKLKLNSYYGGEWMAVDECMISGEILMFNDGQMYEGFDHRVERYSKAIKPFNLNKNS